MKKNHKKIINYEIVSLNKTANSSTMANVYILSHTCPPYNNNIFHNMLEFTSNDFCLLLPSPHSELRRNERKTKKNYCFFLENFAR